MGVIKQVKKRNLTTQGFDYTDIGAEAQYVDVSYDANGNIIEDITEPGVVVSSTKSVAEALNDIGPGGGTPEFVGTLTEWIALTPQQKSQYTIVNILDDSETGETVDAVTDGDMRAVTSNAVYDAIGNIEADNIVEISQADYDELTEQEKHNGKAYFIYDAPGGGGGSLDDLSDVTILTPSNNQMIIYDSANNKWINQLVIGSGSGRANSLCFREEITEITNDMWQDIYNGNFEKVHVGMHYTAPSGRTYWFAHANYNKDMGSTEQTRNTMLVIEDDITITSAHHSTNTTEGGAVASDIYTTVLPAHQSELETDFGAAHIIPQDIYLTNAVTNGVASGGAWTSRYSFILNEKQIFGNDIRFTDGAQYFRNFMARERQLALFANMPETIIAHEASTTNRKNYWTDTIESAAYFALAHATGFANIDLASSVLGVRRAFFIG